MIFSTFVWFAVFMATLKGVNGGGGTFGSAPACVSNCWENSKYVTGCKKDDSCFCNDTEFQAAVHQCLYSQCPTAQFGSALHHAVSACLDFGPDTPGIPQLIRRGHHLRKRESRPAYLSGSIAALPTKTNNAYGSVSAQGFTRTTRGAFRGSQFMTTPPTPTVIYGPNCETTYLIIVTATAVPTDVTPEVGSASLTAGY